MNCKYTSHREEGGCPWKLNYSPNFRFVVIDGFLGCVKRLMRCLWVQSGLNSLSESLKLSKIGEEVLCQKR